MLNHIAVVIKTEHEREVSELLAKQLSLPIICKDQASTYQFWLFFETGILKLLNSVDSNMGPVSVDFSSGKSAYRQKHHGKGKLPISKACGIKHNHRPVIIDATAGLGQDAFVLAGLGCQILCIEQHPVLAALLNDGLIRAGQGEQWLVDIVKNMRLQQAAAESVLTTIKADVIYLDPMYPHEQNKKQAKVNKGMQLFRAFPETSSNEGLLLKAALSAATDRVVVKRPDWALPMAEQQPTYQITGKNHRYDVYKIETIRES
mgnify:CR=1 FL=1